MTLMQLEHYNPFQGNKTLQGPNQSILIVSLNDQS